MIDMQVRHTDIYLVDKHNNTYWINRCLEIPPRKSLYELRPNIGLFDHYGHVIFIAPWFYKIRFIPGLIQKHDLINNSRVVLKDNILYICP